MWRIATHQILGNISLLLFFDFLILLGLATYFMLRICAVSLVLASGAVTATAASDAGTAPAVGEAPGVSGGRAYVPDTMFDEYQVTRSAAAPAGLIFFRPAAALLGVPEGTIFRLEFQPYSGIGLLNQWAHVRTTVALPVRETGVVAAATGDAVAAGAEAWAEAWAGTAAMTDAAAFVEVSFTHDTIFFLFLRGFCVLLGIEIITVVRGAFRIHRSTRRLLRPIMELTRAAQSIGVAAGIGADAGLPVSPDPGAVAGMGAGRADRATRPERRSHADGPDGSDRSEPALKLSGAIDTLNTITEQHLDKRILIEDERVELKGLASAINGMLDRLDAAYHAQLRFVSDASHELRTPISVIQGYANLLDRWGKNDGQTLQESIDAIKNEAESMKDLVEQLLFLARGDNHSIVLARDPVDLSQLAEEVVRETKMIDGQHEFRADITPGLVVRGDAQLLKQALRIFTDNSIKYTPAGGQITIRTARSDRRAGYIDVSVSDSGIGIPEEALPHVFDRFFRADESRARKSGGTGLGLAIAKWIIDSHQGVVEVLSRKDAGSKFTMSYPDFTASAALPGAAAHNPASAPPAAVSANSAAQTGGSSKNN
ncbi:MAG: HAMP domain-containing histidine kinase [Clostridiales bacterium]|nr:HAMP domain-containing histidine kinase [Clostridiales bacterium]